MTSPEHDPFRLNRIMLWILLFGRVFYGEPVPTSPENAPAAACLSALVLPGPSAEGIRQYLQIFFLDHGDPHRRKSPTLRLVPNAERAGRKRRVFAMVETRSSAQCKPPAPAGGFAGT